MIAEAEIVAKVLVLSPALLLALVVIAAVVALLFVLRYRKKQ